MLTKENIEKVVCLDNHRWHCACMYLVKSSISLFFGLLNAGFQVPRSLRASRRPPWSQRKVERNEKGAERHGRGLRLCALERIVAGEFVRSGAKEERCKLMTFPPARESTPACCSTERNAEARSKRLYTA